MPLPDDPRASWPPADQAALLRDIAEADAWYSGDEKRLAAIYGGATQQHPTIAERLRFWSRPTGEGPGRQRVHLPIAADVAATAADLLFGDTPTLIVPEAHEDPAPTEDGRIPNPSAEAVEAGAAEERLAELLELGGVASTLLEGAEVGSALGGVYLRPMWDPELADHPLLTVVHPDFALPEFRWGHLVAVTFWREVARDGQTVWRHLERHETGGIFHGLFVGTATTLGTKIALTDHADTAGIGADSDGMVAVPNGVKGLLVRYVPNVRPNRKHRGKPVGRADTAGVESLMDSADETWTSWMRDIRLAKGRLVVPQEFLERRGGRGGGATFDMDTEVFAPVDMDPASREKAGITLAQFAIRAEEHAATLKALFEAIVRTAGYSPQSFGMHGSGSTVTATEIDAREDRSDRTTSRKRRYWRAVEEVAENMLIIDREIFGTPVTPMRPRLDWPDNDGMGMDQLATTLDLLTRAEAASIETKVRMVNPDWDAPQVLAEVDRIKAETGLVVADPTGGLP